MTPGRRRELSLLVLALAGVAVLTSLVGPSSVKLDPTVDFTEPVNTISRSFRVTELVDPPMVATVRGIRPGLERTRVEKLLREHFGADYKLTTSHGSFRYGPDLDRVEVCYSSEGRVTRVSGSTLELDGAIVLNARHKSKEDVLCALGTPDSSGCAGIEMCLGPFDGYRYEAIQATIYFSYYWPNSIELGPHHGWCREE